MRIIPSPSLAPLTTLRLGGFALAEARLTHRADFDELPTALKRIGGTPLVLGGGSNLLVAEDELPITLIRPLCGADQAPVIVRKEDGAVWVHVGAGLRMPALLAWCAKHGLSGLEGLVGVPGRVGGAVAMNAGAYGCSMGSVLRALTVYTPEKGVHELSPDSWTAAYRHFSLKEAAAWFVVIDAGLILPVTNEKAVRAAMVTHLASKKNTQPLTEHTAGCVFKNPPGVSAGKLLDDAGMRGKRVGTMYFTKKHANFLAHDRISPDSASSTGSFTAAAALITEARNIVSRQTGITLELEIKVWPCPLF